MLHWQRWSKVEFFLSETCFLLCLLWKLTKLTYVRTFYMSNYVEVIFVLKCYISTFFWSFGKRWLCVISSKDVTCTLMASSVFLWMTFCHVCVATSEAGRKSEKALRLKHRDHIHPSQKYPLTDSLSFPQMSVPMTSVSMKAVLDTIPWFVSCALLLVRSFVGLCLCCACVVSKDLSKGLYLKAF